MRNGDDNVIIVFHNIEIIFLIIAVFYFSIFVKISILTWFLISQETRCLYESIALTFTF